MASQWRYDAAGLDYASDTRGRAPFIPSVQGRVFRTLQVPTTLPTLDELLGRPEYPSDQLVDRYLSWLQSGNFHVYTAHAEIEGMKQLGLFRELLTRALQNGWRITAVEEIARASIAQRDSAPVCEMIAGEIDGRSGTLALQGPVAA